MTRSQADPAHMEAKGAATLFAFGGKGLSLLKAPRLCRFSRYREIFSDPTVITPYANDDMAVDSAGGGSTWVLGLYR